MRDDWQPLYDGVQCYSLQKGAELEHVVVHIRRAIEAYGIVVEASNTEYGPAQIEINMGHGPALEVCDDTMVFKSVVREIALQPRAARDVHGRSPSRASRATACTSTTASRSDGANVLRGAYGRRPAGQRVDAPLGGGAGHARARS